MLLNSGSDPKLKNNEGEDPLSATTVEAGATQFVAGLLKVQIDIGKVQAGRPSVPNCSRTEPGARNCPRRFASRTWPGQDVAGQADREPECPGSGPGDHGPLVGGISRQRRNCRVADRRQGRVNGKGNPGGPTRCMRPPSPAASRYWNCCWPRGPTRGPRARRPDAVAIDRSRRGPRPRSPPGSCMKLDQKTVDAGRAKCSSCSRRRRRSPSLPRRLFRCAFGPGSGAGVFAPGAVWGVPLSEASVRLLRPVAVSDTMFPAGIARRSAVGAGPAQSGGVIVSNVLVRCVVLRALWCCCRAIGCRPARAGGRGGHQGGEREVTSGHSFVGSIEPLKKATIGRPLMGGSSNSPWRRGSDR
ncbi:MAG: hypothetical protein Ct9H300mP1_35550 [Planctomycetaceae bacterium]|nr:MAG: hypothetical protein Ct9H300mP1_35550 [Planctomycetaceae bacterium]